jgi:septum formation protein
MRLVLASQSPRRKEILAAAGFQFSVRAPNIQELRRPGEAPADYVVRLAQEKAGAVDCAPGEIILAADTVVVVGGEVLEKPRDASDASRMLRLLAGREHQVITGICVRTKTRKVTDCGVTTVLFSPLTDKEIASYVASGEPLDKAGAYAIQGLASRFIERIEGCYFNVVGLPIALVYKHLPAFAKERE